MRMGMWRKISTWSVTLLGLILAIWGGFAMWTGWPIIQVERGWGLFIAGAAALAGGVTTFGLGQVLARLDALLARQTPRAVAAIRRPAAQAPAKPPVAEKPAAIALAPVVAEPPPAPEPERPTRRAAEHEGEPEPAGLSDLPLHGPHEVDRFESGDTTYVMYSDGSVDVVTHGETQHYASLAELREHAAQQY